MLNYAYAVLYGQVRTMQNVSLPTLGGTMPTVASPNPSRRHHRAKSYLVSQRRGA